MLGTRGIPKGNHWLLDAMRASGYKINPDGTCFGVGLAGIQAALVSELDRFYNRLLLIANIIGSEHGQDFPGAIQRLDNQRLKVLTAAKIKAIEKFKLLSVNERLEFENQPFIQTKLKAIAESINKSVADPIQKKAIYEKIKNELLANLYAQPLIAEELTEKLPLNVQLALEIFPFFGIVDIRQQPQKYLHLLPKGSKIPSQRDIEISSELTLSQEIEKQGGLCQSGFFTGSYTKSDLIAYFSSLESAIQEADYDKPYCLLLSAFYHTIAISYDPVKKKWTFIDPANLELCNPEISPISTLEQLADQVLTSFSENSVAIFTTIGLGLTSNQTRLVEVNEKWMRSRLWETANEVTPNKSTMVDHDGVTWLHIASLNDNVEKVTELLDNGALVDARDDDGNTPLLHAVQRGALDIVEALVNRGANVNVNDWPLFMIALQDGRPDIANALLSSPTIDVNAVVSFNRSMLYCAVARGHTELVMTLLAKGADPNLAGKAGNTPLHLAILMANTELAEILLASGLIDLTLRNEDGNTALLLACEKGDADIIASLLKYDNQNIDDVDSLGYSSLLIACEKGDLEVVKVLLSFGADPNHKNAEGSFPLYAATSSGAVEVVKELLDSANDLDINAEFENTSSFTLACVLGDQAMVEVFLNSGKANPFERNNEGASAFLMACNDNQTEVVQMLLDYGLSSIPNFNTSFNEQYLDAQKIAGINNNQDLAELLSSFSNSNPRGHVEKRKADTGVSEQPAKKQKATSPSLFSSTSNSSGENSDDPEIPNKPHQFT